MGIWLGGLMKGRMTNFEKTNWYIGVGCGDFCGVYRLYTDDKHGC